MLGPYSRWKDLFVSCLRLAGMGTNHGVARQRLDYLIVTAK